MPNPDVVGVSPRSRRAAQVLAPAAALGALVVVFVVAPGGGEIRAALSRPPRADLAAVGEAGVRTSLDRFESGAETHSDDFGAEVGTSGARGSAPASPSGASVRPSSTGPEPRSAAPSAMPFKRWCGFRRSRGEEEKIRHRLHVDRLLHPALTSGGGRVTPTGNGAIAPTGNAAITPDGGEPATRGLSYDVGNIAVIEDDSGIMIPRNTFDFRRGSAVVFTPASTDSFAVSTESRLLEKGGTRLSDFVGDPAGSSPTDDGYKEVPFSNGFTFPFYGRVYDRMFVGTNGYLTFESGDPNSPADISAWSFAREQPRIAAFWADLNVTKTGIYVIQAADRVIVTWKRAPIFSKGGANTFQVQLYPDGRIAFVYGHHTDTAELIGLSAGGNRSPLREVDLSHPQPTPITGAPFERFNRMQEIDLVILSRAFLATHGDDYDFIYVWSDFQTDLGDAIAFYLPVKNDVTGTGQDLFDDSDLYGSAGRLQGVLEFGKPDDYPDDPSQVFLGLDSALSILAHEQGHRWLAYPRFLHQGSRSRALLKPDRSHWSFYFNTESTLSTPEDRRSSVLEGNVIEPLGPHSFITAERSTNDFSALDQYLMGLRGPDEVSDSFVLRGAGHDRSEDPESGLMLHGSALAVSVDDIIAAEGPRSPAYPETPHTFHAAWVLLVRQGTTPSQESLAKLELFRATFESYFNQALEGRGSISTVLSTTAR